ncbi:choice-of-anchor U domain-containing protein [Methanocaldococcus sp. 16A]
MTFNLKNILIFIFTILLWLNISVGVNISTLNESITFNNSNSTIIGNFSNISQLNEKHDESVNLNTTNFIDLNNITKNLKKINTKLNNTINIPKNITNYTINKTKNKNKSYKKDIYYLNVSVEEYKIIIKTNGIPYGFANKISLKFVKINNETYIISPVILNIPIEIYAKFDNETLNKTIYLNYSENNSLNNTKKLIILKEVYFPAEKIFIKINFKPNKAHIITPNNKTIDLKIHKEGRYYYLSAKLNKNVILGNYSVLVDGIKRTFVVDYYKINAKFNNSYIFGNVSYYYVMPKIVEYTIMPINLSGNVTVENSSFCVPINLTDGNYTVILKCGNAITKVPLGIKKLSLKVPEIAFVGNKIKIAANFKPENAKIIAPYKNLTLNFSRFNTEKFVSTFVVNNTGVYKIVVDNIIKEVYVDNYTINASLNGSKIVGNICWKYIPPKYINYTFMPVNISGKVEVKNSSSFVIEVPKGVEVVKIRCGNANVSLPIITKISDFRVVNVSIGNKTYSINVTINKGKFKELKFEGGKVFLNITNLTVGGSVNLMVRLPFKIPEGMYIYYWKKINNKTVPVNYTINKDRRTLKFTLKDGGVADEDGKKNGVIVDPFKFYIPKYYVKTEFKNNNKTGILHVMDLKGNELYNITVKIDKGMFDYIKFIDKENIPIKINANLPYNLIKFRISNISKGERVNVNITYSKNILQILDNTKIYYYKFNPNTLKWYSVNMTLVNRTTISISLIDGGLGDDDNKTNGVIEDDGGVGWVGYYSEWDVVIGSLFNQQIHTYWLYVPEGINNFSFGVYDGDGLIVDIYYPNGTLYSTLNESANNNWNYTEIYTNKAFGFWKIVINNSLSQYPGGNFYSLNISGSDSLDLKVNMTYIINGNTYYGSPNATLLNFWDIETSNHHDFYVYATSDFNIAIFDPDNNNDISRRYGNRLKVSVYYPNGTLYYSFYPYDNSGSLLYYLWYGYDSYDNPTWVIQNISIHGHIGWWRIELTQEQDYDDGYGDNQIILATNISNGLWFKILIPSSSDSGSATICRDNQTNMVHRYYTMIPYGISNYTIGIYDGDGLIVNVSYPNGTLYNSYTAPNDAQNGEPPNYFQIDTNNVYGWWIVDIFENSWPSSNGNYYSLSTINSPVLKLNKSYNNGYYGTPDTMIVGDDTSNLGKKTWYISTPKGLSSFNLSIYDGDGAINVSIYLPNGTKYKEFTAYGDEIWYNYTINVSNPNQNYGVWKIVIYEIKDYDDYLSGGNVYKIVTTTKTGILSGSPRYNLSIVDIIAKSLVNTSETFNITVYVKNTGTMDMSNVSVNITLPNGWSGETNKVVPYILPNQTVALNFTLSAPLNPGSYTITVNATNDYVHWDSNDYKNVTITVISNKKINITSSISVLPNEYVISVKSFENTTNVYVYWYKPDNINVINISGDFDENGTYNSVYWFKFNTINENEIKSISITTNTTTIEGFIIGIDPK